MMRKSFVYGVEVTDYNFTGREQEMKRMKADFLGGLNVILMSPRRMGKTSLVKQVCKDLKESSEVLTVYVDAFGCKSDYEFYNKLAAAVLYQTSSRTRLWLQEAGEFLTRLTPKISLAGDEFNEYAVSLGISPKTHSPEEILSLAEKIAARKGKHIVVCIDEFQQVGEWTNGFQAQAVMRGVWQHQQHASYCLFGSQHHLMSNIFLNKSMPFFQFGDVISLGPICTEAWVGYIVSHFADAGRGISPELAQRICQAVGGYSAYVQQLAWQVLQLVESGQVATEQHVKHGLQDLIDINGVLFAQIIDQLSGYQMNFLRAVASGVTTGFGTETVRSEYQLGSYSNIKRLKTALLERDILKSDLHGHMSFTDPVFALWFKQKFILPE